MFVIAGNNGESMATKPSTDDNPIRNVLYEENQPILILVHFFHEGSDFSSSQIIELHL